MSLLQINLDIKQSLTFVFTSTTVYCVLSIAVATGGRNVTQLAPLGITKVVWVAAGFVLHPIRASHMCGCSYTLS